MMRFTLLLLFAGLTASAQSPWRMQSIDSAGFTPTAMGTVEDLVAVASQPVGSTFFPRTGDLRLRIHPVNNQTGDLQTPQASAQFPGEFIANHIAGMDGMAISRFLIAGGFHDTCYLPNDTLIGFEPLALDPFLMRVNAHTGQPEWVWHRRQAQNNYFHKISYDAGQGIILASGLYDDVSGWLAAFNAINGQLLWEKAWTGARTVSDARFDLNFPGAVLFTGTIDDFGHLNNIPTPLTPLPNTGYRTFLARYWPANDSVQFIATTPFITFDFESAILSDNPIPLRTSGASWLHLLWSTPSFQNGQQQIISHIGGTAASTAIDHHVWHGQFEDPTQGNTPAGPVFFYQAANVWPASHVVKWHRGTADSLWFNTSSEAGKAGALGNFGIETYLTVKATGPIRIKTATGSDSTFTVPGATPFTPQWVLLHRSVGFGGGIAEARSLAFKVYPNPTSGHELFLQLDENAVGMCQWQLNDLHGRRLASGSMAADDNRIQLPALSAGVYLLEVQQGEKMGTTRVVVK